MRNCGLSSSNQKKRLTIGLPVYNGEKFIRSALDSILAQTYSDFEVLISDNASTDKTLDICKEYIERDNRISYIRQKENLGAFFNFEFLLKRAKSPYFIWLAADDSWEPDFLAENIAALDADLLAIASISKVAFYKKGSFSRLSNGTYPLDNTIINNLRNFLLSPSDNSRFYSVFRTSVIQNAFIGIRPCHAADWLIMAITLLEGKHIETPNILMYRMDAESNRYIKQLDNDASNFFTKIFPILPMTYYLSLKIGLRNFILLFLPILRLTINKHIEYVRIKYGIDNYCAFLNQKKIKEYLTYFL